MSRRTGGGGNGPVVVLGDALLDRDIDGAATRLCPDAAAPVIEVSADRSRPGGAALAACLAARGGREVVLVTALGDGQASETVRRLVAGRVRLVELPLDGDVPVKTRIMADGRALARVDSGGGAVRRPADGVLREVLGDASGVLIADYGRGAANLARPVIARIAAGVPVVWDPHPRGGPPEPGVRLATPNAAEAKAAARELAKGRGDGSDRGDRGVDGRFEHDGYDRDGDDRDEYDGLRSDRGGSGRDRDRGDANHHDSRHDRQDRHHDDGSDDGLPAQIRRASALVGHWRAATVAITLGARGAVLSRGADSPIFLPAPFEATGDACGAGDCFASAAALALADQALPEEAVRYAVAAATGFVARGGVGDPHLWDAGNEQIEVDNDAFRLAKAVREGGGTVVATGGCFDLLHAGHVELLQAARRLGDCLIVCLNSDASVRRLKGEGRPLNNVEDRSRVLSGLQCVDAVAVFEESTPIDVIRRLRPHLWVKGGDYTPASLPERATLREWSGEALVLPYVQGHSTTELTRRAADAIHASRPEG
jgi:rfaE bifunctional protein nucleotidyltransferase chain/domain